MNGAPDATKNVVFQCNRWLDAGEDDHALSRELAANGADGKPALPWVHYRVQVRVVTFSVCCHAQRTDVLIYI